MCGIAGTYNFVDPGLLRRMCGVLAHRGPDDEGYYTDASVGLGMRRLAVIDVAGGHQPMFSEDGGVVVVFNGEIYNFAALRRTLRSAGHAFRTLADTEVIVHGYEEWGDGFLQRLRGMFALALWDVRRRRLLLARDRLGIKPLYYCERGGRLAFASEIKALLQAEYPRVLDPLALDAYLSCAHVPAPLTIFAGMRKLLPGHLLICGEAGIELRRYWNLDAAPHCRLGFRDACVLVRETLEDAVRLHLVSDVPVGAFLSGGIDSSILVALMSRLGAAPVRTFTLGFEARAHRFDERPYARAVAQRYATAHHEVPVRVDVVGLLPRVIWHFDEPFANDTALILYQLAAAVRPHVTVVLAGTGGDEMFAGYSRYMAMSLGRLYCRAPRRVRAALAQAVLAAVPEHADGRHFGRRLRSFVRGSLLSETERYLHWVTYLDQPSKQQLYAADLAESLAAGSGADHIRTALAAAPADGDVAARVFYADATTYLPNDQLEYNEKMTMAHGLEMRVPFCDDEVAAMAARIPFRVKVHRWRSKALLRAAFRDLLPPEVLGRRKVGLHAPVGIWLRSDLTPLVNELLAPERVRRRGYFRPEAVSQMIAEHRAGRRDHSWPLWMLLVFEIWHQMYLDGGGLHREVDLPCVPQPARVVGAV